MMKIGAGHAFSLEAGDPFENRALRTAKTFELVEGGRRFLIERIPYADLAPHLAALPQAAAFNAPPAISQL